MARSLTAISPLVDHVRGIVSRVTQRIVILRLVKRAFVNSSVLLRCYYAFVSPILEYCSPVWGSAAECHLQLLERQVYSVARLGPDRILLSLCHRRHAAVLCMLYKVNSNSNHCLFSELPSASVRVRHIRDAAAAHPLEFEVTMCRTSQFARCFLPAQTRVWNYLPDTVFVRNQQNPYLQTNFSLQQLRATINIPIKD